MSTELKIIASSLERIAKVLENGSVRVNIIHGHIEHIDHAHIDDGDIDVHNHAF